MYLRFAIVCPEHPVWPYYGVFQALYDLFHDDAFEPWQLERFDEVKEWFNECLDRPTRFRPQWGRSSPEREAFCWYRPTPAAQPAIDRMWDLAALLEARDIPVRLLRTRNPGSVIYQDAKQVAAVPPRPPRVRRQRRRRRRRHRTFPRSAARRR